MWAQQVDGESVCEKVFLWEWNQRQNRTKTDNTKKKNRTTTALTSADHKITFSLQYYFLVLSAAVRPAKRKERQRRRKKTPTLNIKCCIRTRTCINNCSQLKCVLFVGFGCACSTKCNVQMCSCTPGNEKSKYYALACWARLAAPNAIVSKIVSTIKCNSISSGWM